MGEGRKEGGREREGRRVGEKGKEGGWEREGRREREREGRKREREERREERGKEGGERAGGRGRESERKGEREQEGRREGEGEKEGGRGREEERQLKKDLCLRWVHSEHVVRQCEDQVTGAVVSRLIVLSEDHTNYTILFVHQWHPEKEGERGGGREEEREG